MISEIIPFTESNELQLQNIPAHLVVEVFEVNSDPSRCKSFTEVKAEQLLNIPDKDVAAR